MEGKMYLLNNNQQFMKVSIEIELPNDKYIEVEFEGDTEWTDDSFNYAGTHCTGGRSGVHHVQPYLVLEYATWDDKKYSVEENEVIENFYETKFFEIEKRFCELAESMM